MYFLWEKIQMQVVPRALFMAPLISTKAFLKLVLLYLAIVWG